MLVTLSSGHVEVSTCKLLTRIQECVRMGHEAKAGLGAQSEGSGGTLERGHQHHVGPENQDSGHKLNQPKPRVQEGAFGRLSN